MCDQHWCSRREIKRSGWGADVGSEPHAVVSTEWGDTARTTTPRFTLACVAAPGSDGRATLAEDAVLAQEAAAGRMGACDFLIELDSGWQRRVPDAGAETPFAVGEPLAPGDHSLQVRAVDGQGAPPPPPAASRSLSAQPHACRMHAAYMLHAEIARERAHRAEHVPAACMP
jgi:hypothetical protein